MGGLARGLQASTLQADLDAAEMRCARSHRVGGFYRRQRVAA